VNPHRMTPPFDGAAVLAALRVQQATQRPHRQRPSRLARYRAEIVQLRQAGASFGELQFYLRQHHVPVARSTIKRYVDALPEMQPQGVGAGVSPPACLGGCSGAVRCQATGGGTQPGKARRGAREPRHSP